MARVKEEWLRRFLVLKNGIPSQDTFFRGLGQEKVVGESNEITAIPEWLQALTFKGHRVTRGTRCYVR